MRACVLTGTGTLRVENRPVPSPGPGEVLVEVSAVGVCGSDVHYYRHGRIGDYVVTAPLVLGHESGGRIAAVGAGVDAQRVGQRVAVEPQHPCRRCAQCTAGRYNLCPDIRFHATPPVDGALCRYVAVDAEMAHPVPDGISDDAAALLEPLSVALAALRKAAVTAGSSVLIAGAGPIGVMCAQTARALGAGRIVVSDPVPTRRERVLGFGATAAIGPDDVATIAPVDAFVDACGIPAAIAAGIRAVGPGGHAVLVGLGSPEQTLPVGHLQNLEITLTGVFRYANTWPAAIALAAAGAVHLDAMVTAHFGLDEVAAALDADADPASCKAVIRPD